MRCEDITLVPIKQKAFNEREFYWGKNLPREIGDVYVAVFNPWTAKSYEELFKEFLKVAGAHKISVRDRKNWVRAWVRDGIGRKKRKRLAELASKDKFGYSFLELQIRNPVDDSEPWYMNAVIDFTAREKEIVGNYVKIPRARFNMFNIEGALSGYETAKGLWVPPDVTLDFSEESLSA